MTTVVRIAGPPLSANLLQDSGPFEKARAALEPLRGKRRSRFILLDVVCPKDHKLATIVKTGAGPLLIGKNTYLQLSFHSWWRAHWHEAGLQDPLRLRDPHVAEAAAVAAFEAWLRVVAPRDDGQVLVLLDGHDWEIPVRCRCRAIEIRGDWLKQQITSVRQRVVWGPE